MKYIITTALVLFANVTVNAQNIYPSTGNVGIGTNTPSASLHVNNGNIKVTNPNFYPYGVNIDMDSTTSPWAREFGISYKASGKVASFGAYMNNGIFNYAYIGGNTTNYASHNATWMTFKPNGYVGIGTIAPSSMLDVNGGNIKATNPNGYPYGINIDVDYNTGNWAREFGISYKGATLATGKLVSLGAYANNENLIYAYIGGNTTANIPVSTPWMVFKPNGNIGVGTTDPGSSKLAVEGLLSARRVKVTQASPWPDYVFDKTYDLPKLDTLEKFIDQHKHLPQLPSAATVNAEGVDLGEVNRALVQKVEELTLYIIQLNKEIQLLKKEKSM